jgi:apolipoprotein D and lipocalin family protein
MPASRRFPPACRLALLALVALLACGCARLGRGDAPDPATVPPDAAIAPLMGEWHVIARVPWFGERGQVESRVEFSPAGPGRVAVARHWREGFVEPPEREEGLARAEDDAGRVWKMRLFKVLPGRLRVLELDAAEGWLLADAPGREYAWILARRPVVDDAAYFELEDRIRGHGVNTDRLRRVPQVPEQEGRLGFEPAARPGPGA